MRKCKQNTVCLEQKNYAIKEFFSQPLVMMVETFRRSDGLGYPFTATFLSKNFCFNALNTGLSLGKTKHKTLYKNLAVPLQKMILSTTLKGFYQGFSILGIFNGPRTFKPIVQKYLSDKPPKDF